jgi:hypothetical protein
MPHGEVRKCVEVPAADRVLASLPPAPHRSPDLVARRAAARAVIVVETNYALTVLAIVLGFATGMVAAVVMK